MPHNVALTVIYFRMETIPIRAVIGIGLPAKGDKIGIPFAIVLFRHENGNREHAIARITGRVEREQKRVFHSNLT
jgi:hypothetical protein